MTESLLDAPPQQALVLEAVSKTFPGMRALDDVSFAIHRGSFHALLGGNGSGKSTLIKILAGVYQGDPGGTIRARGESVDPQATTPAWSRRAGIRFVHQDLGVFGAMSVAENLFSGHPYPRTRIGAVGWRSMQAEAARVLARHDIDVDPRRSMADLRPAEQTLVAIARCLMDADEGGVELLVLDEPTARLPPTEVEELLAALDRYVAGGLSILYVSHRLSEVVEHADTITVLRDGRHVTTRPADGLTRAELATLIVGSRSQIAAKRATRTIGSDVVLRVEGLRSGPVHDVDLTLHAGEIVGLAGLVGSGRTHLVETIFGVHRPREGRVSLRGRPLRPGSVAAATDAGLAYVPEDRAAHSAFRSLGLDMNLSAADLHRYRRGWLRRPPELADAQADIARFAIRTPGVRAPFAQLSGGNQQKAVLARWLRRSPVALLLDEPTQGVDIGARAEIYAQIEEAVDRGTAVLLVTSDLDELLHLSDRVAVISRGRIVDEATGDRITRDWVGSRMFDAHQEES
ncbi:sugar ABC transporter ATP-binding protein [Nocardioides mangrovi]|uniref:Sugar ABC transporter ATP-binding protein n=1 Tax=Nocardioides mangrovi TaxID=2874580 RepID=A0ABS7UFU8_9ACTN|nr:sugar ABC transporter ATP-binding protein [Nocardioides mangrovi]MBZ5739566.1 sugar ABC transporter ATP-binding protein [Nocardioides mangrovi]